MPHTKSQIKSMRKSEKRRIANKSRKSRIKTEIKKFLAMINEGQAEAARQQFSLVSSLLDKAAAKRVIHPNNAANKKSKLAKKLAALS